MSGFVSIQALNEIVDSQIESVTDWANKGLVPKAEAQAVVRNLESVRDQARWSRIVLHNYDTRKIKEFLDIVTIENKELIHE
jgi:hypothetical protein